jgi:hypothetical protein
MKWSSEAVTEIVLPARLTAARKLCEVPGDNGAFMVYWLRAG